MIPAPEILAAVAALTLDACSKCPEPYSCCVPEGCAAATAHMIKTTGKAPPAGEHPTLRYMTPTGCSLAPHQRPTCAMHCCRLTTDAGRRASPQLHRDYVNLRAGRPVGGS